MNLVELNSQLNEYSNNTWLISSLSKILQNLIENDDGNIQEVDIISLIIVLNRMIEEQKNKIELIKIDLFGI